MCPDSNQLRDLKYGNPNNRSISIKKSKYTKKIYHLSKEDKLPNQIGDDAQLHGHIVECALMEQSWHRTFTNELRYSSF